MDAGLKLLRLAGGKTEATGQAEMRSDRVLRKRKLVKEEGKYLLCSIDLNLKLIKCCVFLEDSNWSNALRRVQDHANFSPWPTAGKFYIFPNEVQCRMVINRNTDALCSWRGNRAIILRNHVHSKHLPDDLTDRKSHLRTLELVPGSDGRVSLRLFTRAINIYYARASGDLTLEQDSVSLVSIFSPFYLQFINLHFIIAEREYKKGKGKREKE